jgi:tRNA (cmo5U34)-methyltransferase
MQASATDRTLPEGKWTFDGSVARVFDDMLARSIPQYALMRQACFEVACRYVQPKTAIVDLGCSRGEALAPFVDKFGARNRHIGIEMSQPMLQAARERFRGYLECGIVDIRELDLRRDYPPAQASVTLSVLTLQFTPIEYRQGIVRQVWKHTVSGGAFVLVEKVLGASADLDALMVDAYYRLKAANGYSREEIERKRLSLEGVLVPVTACWNEELLRMAGFRQVDCFWRWMNFAGWVAAKE